MGNRLMFEKLWPRIISVVSTWRWHVVSALVLYTALMALNWADVLHSFWVLIVLVLIEILRGTPEVLTRLIIAAGVFIGAVPVTGWLHLPTIIDPICVLLALWSLLLVHEIQKSGLRPTAHSITPLPALLGGVFTYQWWSGFSDGSPAVVLEKLMPIWDLSAHFNFFLSNLLTGTFIAQAPDPGAGLIWEGREYPTGIHFVWGRFAAGLRNEISYDTPRAIAVFANSIVVTVALAVVITGLCMGRLGRSWSQRFTFTALGTGAGAGLLALGPMSQTIWSGFANMSAVIIGLSLLISICVRPIDNHRLQLMMMTFGVWIVVYNWYPTILLVTPALIYGGMRIAQEKGWRDVLIAAGIVGIGSILPIWYSLALGVSHLEDQGGVQPFPVGFLVGGTLSAFAVALMGFRGRPSLSFTLLGVPPAVLLIVHGVRLRVITDGYPYYFHKASLFIASFALLLLMALLLARVSGAERQAKSSRSTVALNLVGAVIGAVSISQIFGYWGPDYQAFAGGNTAQGVLYRNDITKGSDDFIPTARLVVREARSVRDRPIRERSCLTLMIPDRLGVLPKDDPKFGGTANAWRDVLANVWFHGLTRSYTSAAKEQGYMTPNIAGAVNDERALVAAISATFDPSSVCVFSSKWVNAELNYLRADWRTRDLQE